MPLIALAMVYKLAGDTHATFALSDAASKHKVLRIFGLWPTVLCYRHSIELGKL